MRRIVLCLALVASGCSRATSEPREVAVNQQVALQPGQSARISGSPLKMWLVQVYDSRCPTDVTCITAGEALSVLELSGADSVRTDTVRIVKQPTFTTYGGYRIEVVSVVPVPMSTRTPAIKTVTLKVSR